MSELITPSVAHRFSTTFIFDTGSVFDAIPSINVAFQRISGLSRELQVTQHSEGGENAHNLWLPEKIQHGTLVMERGITLATELTLEFDAVMSGEKPVWANVLIMLLSENNLPLTSWLVSRALPVRWQTSDFDANSNTVMINTLELRYQNMTLMGAKM